MKTEWADASAILPGMVTDPDDGHREVSDYVVARVRVPAEVEGEADSSYPAVARLVRDSGVEVWVAPREGEEFNLEDVTHWAPLPSGFPE